MPSPIFTLSSSAFADGGAVPRQYTCDGPDISPPLAWEGAPAEASAFALIVDDPDAHGFVHWVVVDLPGGSEGSLAEGASGRLAAPVVEGRNDFGRRGYAGPCPPSGTHRYRFTLLALSAPLGLPAGTTAAAVAKAAEGRTLATVTLDATYRRG